MNVGKLIKASLGKGGPLELMAGMLEAAGVKLQADELHGEAVAEAFRGCARGSVVTGAQVVHITGQMATGEGFEALMVMRPSPKPALKTDVTAITAERCAIV